MAEFEQDWSSDSNEAVNVSLVAPGTEGLKTLHSFHPKMTYSVFGDEERIFGYQGLNINLRFNASDMRPGLQIIYNKKFKDVGETKPTDLKAILENYLPKNAFEKSTVFEAAVAENHAQADWHPPGELYKTFQSGGQTCEIWMGSLADLAIQQLLKRIQILIPFFIEGGTLLDLEPESVLERWTVFFLYNKSSNPAPGTSPYTFMGYCTVFRYFFYQPPTPPASPPSKGKNTPIQRPADLDFTLSPSSEISFSSLPCRSRISQFLILPPFHGRGHGSRFYSSIFAYYLHSPTTIEITVEDPNEAFDDLRDINDLALLRTLLEFTALRINTACTIAPHSPLPADILDTATLDTIRRKMKIAPRQFSRVVEMQLLSLIPAAVRLNLPNEIPPPKKSLGKGLAEKQKEYRLWKLIVKKRLYKHNKDMLIQLDKSERIDKLEGTVEGVELDYLRLLRALGERGEKGIEGTNGKNGNGKRRVVDDDGEEDIEAEGPVGKKVKT